MIPENGRYRHYKGGIYVVVGTAQHAETDEVLVLYHRESVQSELLYPAYARPLSLFAGMVPVPYELSRMVPRFRWLGAPHWPRSLWLHPALKVDTTRPRAQGGGTP